ncbi:MAG: ABC transporter ATP-binding protein [Candidatus Heimdallarchaeota archaeon]|nr:ABC transporter ATP-binding protein [Candidatus Heimdallarchaeota archaeon]
MKFRQELWKLYTENSIKIRNLTVKFQEKTVLDNLHLTIHPKEYLVILGPTGAGKTTLLRTIAGLLKPTQGNIVIGNFDITNLPPEDREVAYLPQNYSLFPYMNVRDNVLFSPRVKKTKTDNEMTELVTEVLDMVGLKERYDAFPNELSGGMMQRVGLARAIAADTKIFLLDEPLRALDARLNIQLRTEIRHLVKDLGITCLHVTHDQDEALSIADRILVLKEGKIVQMGKPATIYNRPQNYFAAYFIGESTSLEGVIQEITDECTIVLLPSNHQLICRPSELEKGVKVKILAKTETIDLNPIEDSNHEFQGDNIFTGEVIDRVFLGKFSNILVKIEGMNNPLIARISSYDVDKFKLNSLVQVKIEPHDLTPFLEE